MQSNETRTKTQKTRAGGKAAAPQTPRRDKVKKWARTDKRNAWN